MNLLVNSHAYYPPDSHTLKACFSRQPEDRSATHGTLERQLEQRGVVGRHPLQPDGDEHRDHGDGEDSPRVDGSQPRGGVTLADGARQAVRATSVVTPEYDPAGGGGAAAPVSAFSSELSGARPVLGRSA